MEQVIGVPIGPFEYDVVDEAGVDGPKTELIVIQYFDGCMRLIEYNSVVLHTVIVLVNNLLTRIILPPWHNVSSVGVHLSTLDAEWVCEHGC